MKWEFDGIALTPKQCRECHKHFIFERYKKVWRVIAPIGAEWEYICYECYKEKQK